MMISYIMRSISLIGETLRIVGRTWGEYWNQFLVKILSYPMPSKETPNPIRFMTEKSHARKRLIILGLMTAFSKAPSVLKIDLSVERMK